MKVDERLHLKIDAAIAAGKRWLEREAIRRDRTERVRQFGPGAADSPQRNQRFEARQLEKNRFRELSKSGRLPIWLERKIGPTLDFNPFAPSESARKVGRPVARIVTLNGTGTELEGFATGFLITPKLLMTNHHVYPSIADAAGTGANFLYERTEAGIRTGYTFEIDPNAFFYCNEELDFAIVGVNPSSRTGPRLDELGIVPLIEATPKILIGHQVHIIQHPEGREKQYATTENRLLDILETGFLHYSTDTLRGSSGSPVFSRDWELVALHHSSVPKIRDNQIINIDDHPWDPEEGDDRVRWIANEGARVSAIVGHLNRLSLPNATQQQLLKELLDSTTDPYDELRLDPKSNPPTTQSFDGGANMANNYFNITGPVTINVHAPSTSPSSVAEPKADPQPLIAPEKVIKFDPKYKNRKGYDPFFLDPKKVVVPTPTISKARLREILCDDDREPLVLKYHHYELVMNKERRLQMWSAVNVDYDPKKKSTRNREEFGTDKWIPDKRIAADLQIFDADFYKPAGNIDRGHIVRREDNAWGDSELEIEYANSDTFHWTNCTPQHEAFNQSVPGRNDSTYRGMEGIWGALENHIQKSRNGNDTKACILAGPVLDAADPSADFGLGDIQYPLKFWKVVCIADSEDDGEPVLRVFGFILDQTDVVDRFGIEAFRPERFAEFQNSLDEITKLTGVVFDKVLHKADTFKAARE